MNQQALQDLVDWQCYGCGRNNEMGLRIKSYWFGDELVCDWHPKPFHAGHPGNLHQGVTATICFCHGAWAATAMAHRNEGREIQNPVQFFYINRSLHFDALRAIPIDSTVTFRASVLTLDRASATVSTGAFVGDEKYAQAETHLIRKTADEMEF
ncbi:MAG: hypothetical protein R3286_04090 [Gammaproteobacteria bacterium]|nr:hypothetical protein [Gammaproteobacteria bacterium]